MKMNGAEITIKSLERQGVTTLSGIPGGANLPTYRALADSSIRHILARHEQGAGFIAQGMARSTGDAAVCLATSGPGATNLLTAIADAKLDSIPIVAITGQVPTSMIGTDAFQEVDTYGLTLPITKHNFLVQKTRDLLHVIPEAFEIASSGRPGPVVIDIPKNIQSEEIEFDSFPEPGRKQINREFDETEIERLADAINSSKRPILYIGGGITHSDAISDLYELSRISNIPVTSTLMGLGCFPSYDPLYLGMLGMHGSRYTNYILDEADLLIALGVRFDDRATGKVHEFCQHASIAHIDIDHSEIDKIKKSNIAVKGDLGAILPHLNKKIECSRRSEWHMRIKQIRSLYPSGIIQSPNKNNPVALIKRISEIAGSDAIITTDVGQHQMWVAQYYPFNKARKFLTSGGLGTMGFGLPAAIGAALANPDEKIICFSGDGSIMMNIQELATLAELDLNITIILMNNGHLGLVRQQQEMFYDKKFIASRFASNPDFAALATDFGIKSFNLKEGGDINSILTSAIKTEGPTLVNIHISEKENVLPIVPPGAANHEMIGGDIHEEYSN